MENSIDQTKKMLKEAEENETALKEKLHLNKISSQNFEILFRLNREYISYLKESLKPTLKSGS